MICQCCLYVESNISVQLLSPSSVYLCSLLLINSFWKCMLEKSMKVCYSYRLKTKTMNHSYVNSVTVLLLPKIVKLAVYGMLPRNLHRRTMMQRLHIFSDDVSPDTHTYFFRPDLLRTIQCKLLCCAKGLFILCCHSGTSYSLLCWKEKHWFIVAGIDGHCSSHLWHFNSITLRLF